MRKKNKDYKKRTKKFKQEIEKNQREDPPKKKK
jgi:hypothetical protein